MVAHTGLVRLLLEMGTAMNHSPNQAMPVRDSSLVQTSDSCILEYMLEEGYLRIHNFLLCRHRY